jgi:predicted PurR-regulated permease PerM
MNWYIIVAFIIVMGPMVAGIFFIWSFLYIVPQLAKKKEKRNKKKLNIAIIVSLVSLLVALVSVTLGNIITEDPMSNSTIPPSSTLNNQPTMTDEELHELFAN